MASKTRGRYVGALDGLRALCALGVVGYHMRLPFAGGGLLGVTVLFVLSGYLVTSGLMTEFSRSRGSIDLKGFWQRRLWRLMPTVVVFIAVTGAVCALWNHLLFTKMRPDILPALFMVINWTKIFSHESYFAAAGAPSPLTHFWSLAIEAQFYLVWPPVFYLLMRKKASRRVVRWGLIGATVVSAALMAVLYVPGADPSRPYYGTDTRAMSLLLGCWLAIVWPMNKMSRTRADKLTGFKSILVRIVGPICTGALVCLMVLTEGYSSFSYYGGILLCSVLSVIAIAALVPANSPFARVMEAAPLTWMGTRSYAIYLWHYPILELLNPLTATTGIPWWKLLAELVLILVVSELSYRLVEQPLRRGISLRGLLPAKAASKDEAGGDGSSKAKAKKAVKGGEAGAANRNAALKALLPVMPALVVTIVATGITIWGLASVKAVTAGGNEVGEKRIMHAQLRKPVQDGVYDVVLIGDSVSLGANEQLNEAFPHGMIDTRGEREAPEALEVLEGYLDSGVVGSDVVISIGTNGVLTREQMDRFVEDAGAERDLWFVNLRSPNAKDGDNNALIAEYVDKYDNVHLIDWYGATEGHDEWLIEDGIHLTWVGRDEYAKLVVDTMGYVTPGRENDIYNVMILGDTVCLDAADELASAFPHGIVDTAEGRSVSDYAGAIESYASQGITSPVVVCVGNEDPLSTADVKALVDVVGTDRDLWLVSVRVPGAWGTGNNRLFERVAKQYDNVRLIDWYAASAGHDDWFEEDGTHLTAEGARAYAAMVAEALAGELGATDDAADAEGETEGYDLSAYDSNGDAYDYDTGTYDYDEGDSTSEDSSSYDYVTSADYGYEDAGYDQDYDADYSGYDYDAYGTYDYDANYTEG